MTDMTAFELQRAVFAKLAAAPALVALLGEARIYDDVPKKPQYPFISFGPHSEKDWSTGSEPGSEHVFTVHVWSVAPTREEVTALMLLVRSAIEDLSPGLATAHLVSIRHEQSDIEREDKASRFKGTIRMRALAEPA